jgi:hypothetical protein
MPFDNSLKAEQTPERVLAMCRLTAKYRLTENQLLEMLQPSIGNIGDKNDTLTRKVLNLSKAGGLIQDNGGFFQCTLNEQELSDLRLFKQKILQLIRNGHERFEFNSFTNWAIANPHLVSGKKTVELESLYFNQVTKNALNREYSDTNIAGWIRWATFLGFGYQIALSSQMIIINPFQRLKDELSLDNTMKRHQSLEIGQFFDWVQEQTPELYVHDDIAVQKIPTALLIGMKLLVENQVLQVEYKNDAKDFYYYENDIKWSHVRLLEVN